MFYFISTNPKQLPWKDCAHFQYLIGWIYLDLAEGQSVTALITTAVEFYFSMSRELPIPLLLQTMQIKLSELS